MKYIEKIKKIYYGWFVLVAAVLIMATGWGVPFNASSIFLTPIADDLGFTRSAISATATIRAASLMIVSFFSGSIFRKGDIKKTMQIATITLIISFYPMSIANSIIIFYILTMITSISVSLIGILPLSLILSNWFIENRGLVMGIAFMGSGIGGIVFSSHGGMWLELFGWRIAYKILTMIIVVIVIPCTLFLIKIHPKDMGLLPYGSLDEKLLGFKEESGKEISKKHIKSIN